jgi:uncharacterized protein YbjT (DUF2867 family)
MKIFLLGGTGATGQRFVEQALKEKHEITAYVRNPTNLAVADSNLHVIQGTLDDETKLKTSMKGHDAVVIALGPRNPLGHERVMETAVRSALSAMKENGIKRIIYLSAFGVGDSRKYLPFIIRNILVPVFLRKVFAEHMVTENMLKSSSVAYTILRPGGLTNKPRTGQYRTQDQFKGLVQISRADVADFM